jgi:hypothetical protein
VFYFFLKKRSHFCKKKVLKNGVFSRILYDLVNN